MKLYGCEPLKVTQAQLERAKPFISAQIHAGERIGHSIEARLAWVLTFLQQDLDKCSQGDWLNLCDELRMYGDPLPPVGQAFHIFDVPRGRTVEEMQRRSLLPRKLVQAVQRQLLRLVEDLHAGKTVTTMPLSIRLRSVRRPNETSIVGGWIGDPVDLLVFRLLTDLQAAEVKRLCQCKKGKSDEERALGIPMCGRWFYARDLRQQYCSPRCGKEGRWTRYWHANQEKINQRRRKG